MVFDLSHPKTFSCSFGNQSQVEVVPAPMKRDFGTRQRAGGRRSRCP
nr:MAG TPA: hypothetical protein [Caudoviricetes sp.]